MSNRPFQTSKDFADALDSFGADLRVWPEALRGEGNAMLQRSEEARRLLREARVVHRVLSERLTVATDSHLVNAILERKQEHDREANRLSAADTMKNISVARKAMVNKGIAVALLIGGGVVAGAVLSQKADDKAAHLASTSDISGYVEPVQL